MIERRLTVSEASRVLGVSRTTLLAAEEAGLLTPLRTPGGHRRYDPAQLRRYARDARDGAAADLLDTAADSGVDRGAGTAGVDSIVDLAAADIAAAVRVAVRPLVHALDADTAGLYLSHAGTLRFTAGFGVPRWLAERLTAAPPPEPVVRALQASRPFVFDPAVVEFPEPRTTGHGLAVALQRDGGPLGVLFVVTRHDLLAGELRFVHAVRDLLVILVEDQRRIVDLEHRLARIAQLCQSGVFPEALTGSGKPRSGTPRS